MDVTSNCTLLPLFPLGCLTMFCGTILFSDLPVMMPALAMTGNTILYGMSHMIIFLYCYGFFKNSSYIVIYIELRSSEWLPLQDGKPDLLLKLWFLTQSHPQCAAVAHWTDIPQSARKPRPYVQGLVTILATFCCWASWHGMMKPSGLATAPCPYAGIAASHPPLLPLNTRPQHIAKQGVQQLLPDNNIFNSFFLLSLLSKESQGSNPLESTDRLISEMKGVLRQNLLRSCWSRKDVAGLEKMFSLSLLREMQLHGWL